MLPVMATLSLIPKMPTPPLTAAPSREDRRWSALERRAACAQNPDGSADTFFYGVTSTGVVCRPTCPSRRPRRENTQFFDSVAQAEDAGFRACLRCKPAGRAPESEAAERIDRVRHHIEEQLDKGAVSLAELARVAGLSPFHLQRSFRAALGISPAEYTHRLRTERFAQALPTTSVTDALYAAGYQSPSRVYAGGSSGLGMTPGERKRLGEHQHIRYSLADSPLGRMIVAATDRGVCFIAFEDTDAALLAELRSRFAAAELTEDHDALAGYVGAVLTHMTESATALQLPLHVRATAFQQRVWKALEAIPRGETRTYSQLAAAIGQPGAARAVGHACGANPVAPVVPCHRVVGKDGSLTGYRWGRRRKEKLLALENIPFVQHP